MLMDIFPHRSPGTFTRHAHGVLALQSRELHRPLSRELYSHTQQPARLFGISLDHGHQANKQGASGVTRVQKSARAQRDGNNE